MITLVSFLFFVCVQFSISSHLVASDILGSEELHPKHLLYHVPKYLKGVHKNEKHFQVPWAVKLMEHLFVI